MIFTYQEKLKGKNVGVVFGSFAPLHQGHLDLIMQAKKENDGGCIVIVCGFDGDKGEPLLPHKKRYRYVREFFADDPLVAVYAINDTEIGAAPYPNGWEKWLEEFERIYVLATEGSNPQVHWYVGEQDYYDYLVSRGGQCTLVNRQDNLISATMIRQNPIKNWDKITHPFKRVFSTNILICGTASEGKTTLTQDLGKYFNAPYSWEYARDYMKESCVSEWELDEADFMAFLDGQYRLNKKLINSKENHGLFFADTDSMVTKMYAEYYSQDSELALTKEEFGHIATTADVITSKCKWDKIYLLYPNGVFVDDHVRYQGHSEMEERQALFNLLVKNIKEAGLWDKVVLLCGGNYWENFKKIRDDIKEIIEQ